MTHHLSAIYVYEMLERKEREGKEVLWDNRRGREGGFPVLS